LANPKAPTDEGDAILAFYEDIRIGLPESSQLDNANALESTEKSAKYVDFSGKSLRGFEFDATKVCCCVALHCLTPVRDLSDWLYSLNYFFDFVPICSEQIFRVQCARTCFSIH
jgi:hypothetical protein